MCKFTHKFHETWAIRNSNDSRVYSSVTYILENSVKDKYIQPLYMFMYTNLKSIDIEHCTMKPHKEDKLPVHIRKPHWYICRFKYTLDYKGRIKYDWSINFQQEVIQQFYKYTTDNYIFNVHTYTYLIHVNTYIC